MSVSVVVAVRRNAWGLRPLMRALAVQDYPGDLQVVVVDNHDTPTLTRAMFPWPVPVHLVPERQVGLSYARNTGIHHAIGDFVLITDPGFTPDPSWVRTMVATLQNGGAPLVSGRVVLATESGAELPPALTALLAPASWPQVVTEAASPWEVADACLGMPRPEEDEPAVFDVHRTGLDPRHLRGGAVELAARLRAAGELVHVTPEPVVTRELLPGDLTVGVIWARAWWRTTTAARWPHVPVPEPLVLPPGWWRTRGGRLALVAVTAERCARWAGRLRPGSRHPRAAAPSGRHPAAVPGPSEKRP
ncbi:hypothetical protein GCM10010315_40050 [Streptomyces luteosporeus]|uniref:Glycosyltransferase 2-like domain-containing protein n=2 Tax=Streptomyces TaxID=1883 RepID=A0ABP6GBD9_9ACTN